MDEVRNIKAWCLSDPETHLWNVTRKMKEVKNIYDSINQLKYCDKPNYEYIQEQLNILLSKEATIPPTLDTHESLAVIFSII